MGIILETKHMADISAEERRFMKIPSLSIFPELVQGFTTRYGGVSTGEYATLNLNFNRPDPKENVHENYRLLGVELGVSLKDMVVSHQIHGNKIMNVTEEHAGMGVIREKNYNNVDGLATAKKGILLVTHYADCVPIYFYDPNKKVIALSHSGWRGTLLNIAGETVKFLMDNYGCKPQDLFASFGPHIKQCCFEVGDDVAKLFRDTFSGANDYISYRNDGKCLIDLEGIITENLLNVGLINNHISGCRICTRCNSEIFFSHRGSNGSSGTGVAFMMIRG